MMRILIKIIPILFILWLICHYFYSLGMRNANRQNKKKTNNGYQRKKVESTVVEKEQDE